MHPTKIKILRLTWTAGLVLVALAFATGAAAAPQGKEFTPGVTDFPSRLGEVGERAAEACLAQQVGVGAAPQGEEFTPGVTDFPRRLGEVGERAAEARLAQQVGVGAASSGVIEQSSHPNDRRGMLGVGGVFAGSGPDASELAVLRDDAPVRPDDRSGIRGPGIAPSEAPAVTLVSAGGFQWEDAAFGAGAAFGLVLVAGLAFAAIRHRGRVVLP
jgi:hypothetical protein